jgi:hypothetical protein
MAKLTGVAGRGRVMGVAHFFGARDHEPKKPLKKKIEGTWEKICISSNPMKKYKIVNEKCRKNAFNKFL